MNDVQQRAVIGFMVLQKKTRKAIHEELAATLGNDSLFYSIAKKWAALFKAGRQSTEDDPRGGRPSTAVTEENVESGGFGDE